MSNTFVRMTRWIKPVIQALSLWYTPYCLMERESHRDLVGMPVRR